MSLDVDAPPPPDLTEKSARTPERSDGDEELDAGEALDAGPGGDYHREELEEFLADGAWDRAFGEWSEHTDLDEAEFAVARELDLFEEYDFFWDEFAERVGFHAPGISEDWRERELHAELDSWGAVSSINASLTELGQTVADLLGDEYVDWDEEYESPDDLPEF